MMLLDRNIADLVPGSGGTQQMEDGAANPFYSSLLTRTQALSTTAPAPAPVPVPAITPTPGQVVAYKPDGTMTTVQPVLTNSGNIMGTETTVPGATWDPTKQAYVTTDTTSSTAPAPTSTASTPTVGAGTTASSGGGVVDSSATDNRVLDLLGAFLGSSASVAPNQSATLVPTSADAPQDVSVSQPATSSGALGKIVAVLVVVALAYMGWQHFHRG